MMDAKMASRVVSSPDPLKSHNYCRASMLLNVPELSIKPFKLDVAFGSQLFGPADSVSLRVFHGAGPLSVRLLDSPPSVVPLFDNQFVVLCHNL
jgi:hypothetical protein